MEFAMEMFMTMKKVVREVNGVEVSYLNFCFKNKEREVIYEQIGELLGFKSDAPEFVQVEEKDIEKFWEKIAKDTNQVRKSMSSIILQIFHSWMSKRILGRMKEHKIMDTELNWLYAGLVKKQAINPTYIMIDRWTCEAVSGTREVGSGCYLTMIAYALEPEVQGNIRFYVPGNELDIHALKQGHYIGGDEQHGYTIGGTEKHLPNDSIKLFTHGKKNWRDDKFLILAKKNKRGARTGESSSALVNVEEEEEEEEEEPATMEEVARSTLERQEGWEQQWANAPENWGPGRFVQQMPPPPPPQQHYTYPPPYPYHGYMPPQHPYLPLEYHRRGPDTSYGA
ncbi:unnamed protein product [Urochloa humidicola]